MFIPVNKITSKIGQDVSLCILTSHAISGCDTTSSLFKIGKRTAYSKLVLNIGDLMPLAELGQSSDVANELPTATKYALLLHGPRATQVSLSISYATTMHAKVTNLHLSSRQQMMPFNSTSDASITRWRYGSKVMKQSQFFGILMAMGGS